MTSVKLLQLAGDVTAFKDVVRRQIAGLETLTRRGRRRAEMTLFIDTTERFESLLVNIPRLDIG